jgi:hypothetical protein
MEYYEISRHVGKAIRTVNGKTLSKSNAAANRVLDDRQAALGNGRYVQLGGNHDKRPEDIINEQPQLEGTIEIENTLRFAERGITYIKSWDNGDLAKLGKAYFNHGKYVNEFHAKKHVDRYGKNIFYGHCFSDDTEILTSNGWIKGIDLPEGMPVATLNLETNKTEFQIPSKYWRYTSEDQPELIHIKAKNVDCLVTPDHGMLRGKDNLQKLTAIGLSMFASSEIPIARPVATASGVGLSDSEIQLLVWIATDGCIENKHVTSKGYPVRWHLKKERKITKLTALLTSLGVEYSISKNTISQKVKIYANLPKWVEFYISRTDKQLPQQFRHATPAQIKVIFNELAVTDGCYCDGTLQYSSAKEIEIDLVQELAQLYGCRSSKTKKKNTDQWVLSINETRDTAWVRADHQAFTTIQNTSDVWCVTVANGTLITRRNGKTIITQNTHDVQSYSKVWEGDGETRVGQSLGCMCRYDLDYKKGDPDKWQQAVSTFYVRPNGMFSYFVSPIFNGIFIAPNGKEYRG